MVFTFVTQSANKFAEAEGILKIKLKRTSLHLPEIQAVKVEEVVTEKVKYAYKALGEKPVIVEDTGLFIETWNGLPGALIKWFVTSVGNEGICAMLDSFPNRRAWATTIVATNDGHQIHLFPGKVLGQIALAPIGDNGFGWDKIFIPDGSSKTLGEMTTSEKNMYSMRRLAFDAMFAHYSQNVEGDGNE